MSRVDRPIIGINWGSSNFRAYRIAENGALLDEFAAPAGVAALDRAGMVETIARVVARWPQGDPIYASGMIGAAVGWQEVSYAEAPAGPADLAADAVEVRIGAVAVTIVPGVACTRGFDGAPDVLRGEEVELLGLVGTGVRDGLVALPGTHTKWVSLVGGRIGDFMTSMSGELFDRLTAAGLLASIVDGEATDGMAFSQGVADGGARRIGLAALLFGARARVVRGLLPKHDAASYIRGLLIGAELADALAIFPALSEATVPLIGNEALCRLYAAALGAHGVPSRVVTSRDACLLGFRALHTSRER